MIVIGLAILAIALSAVERTLYAKEDRAWDMSRLFIGVAFVYTLFLLAYYATDTVIDLVYVLGTVLAIVILGLIDSRLDYKHVNLISNIIGIPFVAYLMIMTFKSSLIRANYILILSIVIRSILIHPHVERKNFRETMSIGVGIVLAISILFFYYKSSEIGKDSISIKQEFVAKDFLEKDLNMQGFEVHSDDYFGSTRGEETILKAYDLDGNFVTMVYKDDAIIDYEFKYY